MPVCLDLTKSAEDVLNCIRADRSKNPRRFHDWNLARERLHVPREIPEKAVAYCSVVRDLQEKPELLAKWYDQFAGKHLPIEVSQFVVRAIETTLRQPDASTLELSQATSIGDLYIPPVVRDVLHDTEDLSYLDLFRGITNVFEEHEGEVCPNVILNLVKYSPPTWPFFPGLPTSKLSSLREMVNLSFFATHPLYVTKPETCTHQFDGYSRQSAENALNHDDDHLNEEASILMDRCRISLEALGLNAPRLHRNFVIPLMMVDLYYKSLVLESIERRSAHMSTLQKTMVDAYLFAHHEEDRNFLPPGISAPVYRTSYKDQAQIGKALCRFMHRWHDKADMQAHFDHIEKPAAITPQDCQVTLDAVGLATVEAALKLKDARRAEVFSNPVRKLLAITAPFFTEMIVHPVGVSEWRSSIGAMVAVAQKGLPDATETVVTILR